MSSKCPRLHIVDARQAALLLLQVFKLRGESRGKPVTQAKLTSSMLKKLWRRPRLAPEFLQEIADWLLQADWVFFYAGRTYAAVRASAVDNWPRVSTNWLPPGELEQIAAGQFDFSALEQLLWMADDNADEKGRSGRQTRLPKMSKTDP